MPRIGSIKQPQNISEDFFTATEGQTQFVLTNGADVGSDAGYIVHVDGVVQAVGAGREFTRSGVTFNASVGLTAGSIVWIKTVGERLDINTPADGTIDHTKLTAGAVVQVVNVMDGVANSGSTILPIDNSIPQNTEGVEFMTLAITPKSTTNKLKIEVVLHLDADLSTSQMAAALFQDSTVDAIAASWGGRGVAANRISQLSFTHFMTAGTTSATTFKVHAGLASAGTIHFNEQSTGTDAFGGVCASSITITEIKA